jgi:predicted HTH domain antitoxin
MEGVIQVEYPESLANSLKLSEKEFEREMKTISLVKLFELGKVSSGTAAKVLGLTRLDFLELLATYKISALEPYAPGDVREDIANA